MSSKPCDPQYLTQFICNPYCLSFPAPISWPFFMRPTPHLPQPNRTHDSKGRKEMPEPRRNEPESRQKAERPQMREERREVALESNEENESQEPDQYRDFVNEIFQSNIQESDFDVLQ